MARIFIVDDETNYRVLLRACLERAGKGVDEASWSKDRRVDILLVN
jgi:hypothetical protein